MSAPIYDADYLYLYECDDCIAGVMAQLLMLEPDAPAVCMLRKEPVRLTYWSRAINADRAAELVKETIARRTEHGHVGGIGRTCTCGSAVGPRATVAA